MHDTEHLEALSVQHLQLAEWHGIVADLLRVKAKLGDAAPPLPTELAVRKAAPVRAAAPPPPVQVDESVQAATPTPASPKTAKKPGPKPGALRPDRKPSKPVKGTQLRYVYDALSSTPMDLSEVVEAVPQVPSGSVSPGLLSLHERGLISRHWHVDGRGPARWTRPGGNDSVAEQPPTPKVPKKGTQLRCIYDALSDVPLTVAGVWAAAPSVKYECISPALRALLRRGLVSRTMGHDRGQWGGFWTRPGEHDAQEAPTPVSKPVQAEDPAPPKAGSQLRAILDVLSYVPLTTAAVVAATPQVPKKAVSSGLHHLHKRGLISRHDGGRVVRWTSPGGHDTRADERKPERKPKKPPAGPPVQTGGQGGVQQQQSSPR